MTHKPDLVDALQKDYTTAELKPRHRAMLDYASKLTLTPGAMTDADLGPLRAAGLDDRDILDLNQVTSYFAYANRVADGLGVAVDEYAKRPPPE